MDEEIIDTFKAMKEITRRNKAHRARGATRFRRDIGRMVKEAGMEFVATGKPDHPVWHIRDQRKVMVSYWPSTTAIRFHPRLQERFRVKGIDVTLLVTFVPHLITAIVETRTS